MRIARPALATVQAAALGFGADPAGLQLVHAGVNTLYRSVDVTLRLSPHSFKSEAYLSPPLAWLRHLSRQGASVCEPLPTPEGEWIVTVQDGSEAYLATAVRWVEGPRLSDLPPTPTLYTEYGRSIGRLHRASKTFVPPPGAQHMLEPGETGVFPRWDWLWRRAARHVLGVPVLARAFEQLTPLVQDWGAAEHGLTHGDLRPGNVIWSPDRTEGGRAVIIDFDEPVIGPAALDLARAVLELPHGERPALTAALLAGYRLEAPLASVWDERLPLLMAARAALMAAWSVEDDELHSGTGSGAVVSVPRLLERLERHDF